MSNVPASPRLGPGDRLGKFTIRSLIGRGKTTEVYRASHSDFRHDVAIKCYQLDIAADSDLPAQFERDVRAIAELRHPNITRVYEAGLDGSRQFIVMELIEGRTLRDLLSTHPTGLERDETVRIFSQIASAIGTAHDQAIVHGNIKPDNVLVDHNQRPVLTDFALPCLRQHPRPTSGPLGTTTYMAPEQIAARTVSVASDIYALGILLYEMVTGDVPFSGDTQEHVAQQHFYVDPVPPGQIAVGLDPRLDFVILKALSKEPTERFDSARDMLAALESSELGERYETLNLRRGDMPEFQKRRSEIVNFQRTRLVIPEEQETPEPLLKKRSPVLIGLVIALAVIALVILAALLL
jgi:eukaryotic-like serine/threonine-protein kinase